MNDQHATNASVLPFVTVVVRSYKRVAHMLEIVRKCLAQEYDAFEVLVIEQSGELLFEHADALREVERDPRLRMHRCAPLGPIGARNEAVRIARGDVLLFIDDDDMPLQNDWLRCHAENFRDPCCIAVSGRLVQTPDEDPTPHNTEKNRRLCLRYSFLKMPRGRARHTFRIQGVDVLQGSNTAIRKSAIERVGGWDEDVDPHHEENSFDFKMARARHPNERFDFDPRAVVWRRLDLAGGLDRRNVKPIRTLQAELAYSHYMVRRYYPWRFHLLYPAYLWVGFWRSVKQVREQSGGLRATQFAWLLAAFAPTVVRTWFRLFFPSGEE